jgi:hypothetical protein
MEKKTSLRKILWRWLRHVGKRRKTVFKKKDCVSWRIVFKKKDYVSWKTVFKEGHNFIFIFLRLWACGLALLFFGLWAFCGSSFFLKGTVGCSNCWIGQFDKKKLSGRAELSWAHVEAALHFDLSGVEELLSGPLFVVERTKLCACAEAFCLLQRQY